MESIIRDYLFTYLKENKILSGKQYGFISGRSTVLQLLTVMDIWTESLDKGVEVDVIYFNFQKAFDTVPHRRLIETLSYYGIRGPVLTWISDFLTDRKLQVLVNGCKSTMYEVLSGVPQGSVLGPLLFIIYINMLIQKCETKNMFLYADDIKIFKEIRSEDDMQDLQALIDKMYDWTNYSLLRFHPEKCVTMRLTPTRNESKHQKGMYNMDCTRLNEVTMEKDLGVYVDNKLSFHEHINIIVKKANGLVSLIRRTFVHLDQSMFKHVFTTIVRPHLEYAAPIWNPYLKKYITMIENVQRRATRQIPGLQQLSYKDRLKSLKLPTLEYRRYRGNMIQTYKIIHNIYDIDSKSFLKARSNARSENKSTAHCFALAKGSFNKDQRKYCFTNRVCDQWNNLPLYVVTAPTINAFKNRLDKIWTCNDVMYDPDNDIDITTSARNTRYAKVT